MGSNRQSTKLGHEFVESRIVLSLARASRPFLCSSSARRRARVTSRSAQHWQGQVTSPHDQVMVFGCRAKPLDTWPLLFFRTRWPENGRSAASTGPI